MRLHLKQSLRILHPSATNVGYNFQTSFSPIIMFKLLLISLSWVIHGPMKGWTPFSRRLPLFSLTNNIDPMSLQRTDSPRDVPRLRDWAAHSSKNNAFRTSAGSDAQQRLQQCLHDHRLYFRGKIGAAFSQCRRCCSYLVGENENNKKRRNCKKLWNYSS